MKKVLLLSTFVMLTMFYGSSVKASTYSDVKKFELIKPSCFATTSEGGTKAVLINLKGLTKSQKDKLQTFFIDMNVGLSCVSITYSGATAEAGFAIIMAGYYNELIAILEWMWCGGGVEVENPYDSSWV